MATNAAWILGSRGAFAKAKLPEVARGPLFYEACAHPLIATPTQSGIVRFPFA
jgi:hypothetical protein